MQPLFYMSENYSIVASKADFFKNRLPETPILRKLYDSVKLTFGLPTDRVIISVAEGKRYYKLTLLSTDIKKYTIGEIYFLPEIKGLDIFIPDNPNVPLLQWRNKKPVWKNYSTLLDMVGLDKLFGKLINSI